MKQKMAEPKIREATIADVEQSAELLIRLKRLNSEFDPMFKVAESAQGEAKKYLKEAIESEKSIVLVAVEGQKIVGVIKADFEDRKFYEPKTKGAIVDFYVLPEFRRKKLGDELIRKMVRKLKEKGAEIVTAEFPSQNRIAVNFYEKLRFRPLVSIYGKRTE